MRWLQKAKEDGVSLRVTFVVMLIISFIITAILLYATFHTIRSFQALSGAMDDYIVLHEAADNLLKASDYMTEEARRYTVIGDRRHLENYFEEVEQTRRRESAIDVMSARLPDSDALSELRSAMDESQSLMDIEYLAMRLILDAQGDTDVPALLENISLIEYRELSPEEKIKEAQELVHSDTYDLKKSSIRTHLNQCINELKRGTNGTQNIMEGRVRRDLIWIAVSVSVQTVSLILLLYLTTRLGVNPILRAVEHIKHDRELPITGAHEFRYLAGTYNRMFSAYKQSISNLSFKAFHDSLTGVYNRAGYDKIKDNLDLSSTAVMIFDVDRFKQINDGNGHGIGDGVLKKVASALINNFRSIDYICRVGGDEFVVFMVNLEKNEKQLIERKVAQIKEELAQKSDDLPVATISVGVSIDRSSTDPEERFNQADTALYYVKNHGRNGCSFFEPDMSNNT